MNAFGSERKCHITGDFRKRSCGRKRIANTKSPEFVFVCSGQVGLGLTERNIPLTRKERKKSRMKERFRTFVIGRRRGNVVVGRRRRTKDAYDDDDVFD